MNILMMMGGGDVGGAKTHIMSLCSGILKHNHNLILVSFRDGSFAKDMRDAGVDVRVITGINIIRARIAIMEIVLQFNPDIVHCHGAKANMMGAIIKASLKAPVISTIHSDYRLDYLGNPMKQLVFGTINAISLRFMDYFITVADKISVDLIYRGFDTEKIKYIPNGISMDNISIISDRKGYLMDKYGLSIDEDDVLCAMVARLTAVKDVKTAILGFEQAYLKNNKLKFIIAGDGEEREELQSIVRDKNLQDCVFFLGWISDAVSLFSCCDINIISSVSEAFPYSVLEGAVARCTTVSTRVGVMPELILNGESGYLYNISDYEDLGRIIIELCDADLRLELSSSLYNHISELYSIEKINSMQIEVYEQIMRCFYNHHDKITICGAYGHGNAGDDAILKAITTEMREIDPYISINVMTRTPKQTREQYRTNAVFKFNFIGFIFSFISSKLYINGGGSLIQDVTSSRSLYYYLFTLMAAKICGCKVIMYGCGIGPVNGKNNRKIAAYVINKFVDVITLRDDISKDELRIMGVRSPEIISSADPTLILRPASNRDIISALDRAGVCLDNEYICFGLRNWKNYSEVIDEIAKIIEYCYTTHKLIPVFVPIETPSDINAAKMVIAKINCPYHIIEDKLPIEVTIGIFSKMKAVIGIRLHSLIFSAGLGVPVIGLSYDIKVDGFIKYLGIETCISLESVTLENVSPLIDRVILGEYNERINAACKSLVERERENVRAVHKLLFPGKEYGDLNE